MFHENINVVDNDGKANLLNNYFAEQIVLDDHLASLPELVNRTDPTLNTIVFSPTEVEEILSSLKLGKASGPDNINNKILKEAAIPLSKPLCDLFNYSMSKCICPDIWKEANVSPLYKKDDPSLVNNYRPISLLAKLWKRLFINICLTFSKITKL